MNYCIDSSKHCIPEPAVANATHCASTVFFFFFPLNVDNKSFFDFSLAHDEEAATVHELLLRRLALIKYTIFGTFFECRSEEFASDNPGQTVMDYNIRSIEDNWEVLTHAPRPMHKFKCFPLIAPPDRLSPERKKKNSKR